MDPARWNGGRLLPVVIAYLLLAAAWGLLIPPFEKADEIHHFAYVQYLAEEGRLPLGRAPENHHSRWEAHQPPLFYVAAAGIYRASMALGLPRTETAAYWQRFGNSFQGTALMFDHPERPGEPGFPYDLYVVRASAMVFGLLAVLATFQLTHQVLGHEPLHDARVREEAVRDELLPAHPPRRDAVHADWAALAAAALLMPQFTHFSSAAGNDMAVAAFGAVFLLQLLRVRQGSAQSRTGPVVLGLTLGLAGLSKLNGLALAPALLVLVLGARSQTGRPGDTTHPLLARSRQIGVAVVAAAGVIAPWWLMAWRSTGVWLPVPSRLSGDFAFDHVPRSLLDPWFVRGFAPDLFQSYVGKVGFMRLELPPAYYVLALGATVAAVLGLALWWRRRRADPSIRALDLVALIVAVVSVGGAVMWHNLSVSQPQGRYLYPAASALAVLGAIGWREALRAVTDQVGAGGASVSRDAAVLLVVLAIAVFNASALYHIWVRAYAQVF